MRIQALSLFILGGLLAPAAAAEPQTSPSAQQTELVAEPPEGSCELVGSKGFTRFLHCPKGAGADVLSAAAAKACAASTACNAWIWSDADDVARSLPIEPASRDKATGVWSGKSRSLLPCDGAVCGAFAQQPDGPAASIE